MQDEDKSLIDHIESLRNTLIKCLLSVTILLPFTFYFSSRVLNYLVKLLTAGNNVTFNYFTPMEVFLLQIKIAFLLSVIIAFPYIVRQIWIFILPALYDHERKFIKRSILLSSLLFVLGVSFCIVTILPLIIRFGMSFSSANIQAVFGISNVINLVLSLSFTFGLMFQVPLVTYMLISWGILSYDTISSKRPYVIVVILIVSALLTPPDIISQVFLFLPTYLLFESGLIFSKIKIINQNKND